MRAHDFNFSKSSLSALAIMALTSLHGCSDSDTTSELQSDGSTDGTIIFEENFEQELDESGGSVLSYQGLTSFTVEGDIDLINSGDFQINCADQSQACIDTDGSNSGSDPAATLTSTELNLAPGNYVLSFNMSGNQRGAGADSISIAVPPFFDEITLTLDASEPMSLREFSFEVNQQGPANVVFTHLGLADNVGTILDDIKLTLEQVVE